MPTTVISVDEAGHHRTYEIPDTSGPTEVNRTVARALLGPCRVVDRIPHPTGTVAIIARSPLNRGEYSNFVADMACRELGHDPDPRTLVGPIVFAGLDTDTETLQGLHPDVIAAITAATL
ncbi:hypothetical protein ACN20G_33240 (plasmid) [Streptomyces sp. BI20]|uniref:hypothetical protein n=1 Tax=Streptomyces sp. BI20 TaxID=3403460 RepID=UPI003C76D8AF